MALVLSGGTIVTAADCYQAEVRIEGDKIQAVGSAVGQPGDVTLDVAGNYLFPGGIDPHTHFDLPVGEISTSDDFAAGTRAALLGGTTTIVDFATQFKGESLFAALENWHNKAKDQCYTDYGFHLAITDWNQAIKDEIPAIVSQGGVSSFKLYMAYKHILQVDDAVLLAAFRRCREVGALLSLHCENGDIIDALTREALDNGRTTPAAHPLTHPVTAEREATQRALALAEVAKAPVYIVHLTCAEALDAVQAARRRGVEVYAETCPQYLLLDETKYSENFAAAKYVISPPLRNASNQQSLWDGMFAGAIDTIATDHCSFNYRGQKELGRNDFSKIPNGMPGVQTRLGLLYTYGVRAGRIDLNKFVDLTSTRAAKLFGLFPQKGTIAVGSDADIVVWDPAYQAVISTENLAQKVDYSPFEGFTQIGKVAHVFLRGNHVVQEGKLNPAQQPLGKYLHRKHNPKRKR